MTPDRRRLGPLAVRLTAAFLVVAVAAVVVLAVLIVVAAGNEVDALVQRQHRADASAAAAAVGSAYAAAGGWEGAELSLAGAVAARSQARLVVTRPDRTLVAAPTDQLAGMMARMHGVAAVDVPRGHAVRAPVVVAGRRVGDVTLTFPLSGLPAPERQVRDALWRTVVAGTSLAAAGALLVALFVARRVTQPVAALTDAASRVARGDLSARARAAHAPGELGTLAAAFDAMAENLQREDELRRTLVTDVAHELRTPLTILRAQTEALVDGVAAPDAAVLASLHEEVLRLTRLVADLETLAAADAARLELRMVDVDLSEVATGAAEAVRPAAEQAGTGLVVEALTARASGDAGRLHQIALNLLTNATKFTPAGGTISLRTWEDAGGAHLEVADTGPGLAPGEEGRVFERFWQGEAGRSAGGSGIGLAVAAELASAHHGILHATNRPDGGASFTLTLPRP